MKFSGAKIYIKRDNGTPYSGYAWKDDNLDGKSELDNANADSDVKYQPVAYPSTSKITARPFPTVPIADTMEYIRIMNVTDTSMHEKIKSGALTIWTPKI